VTHAILRASTAICVKGTRLSEAIKKIANKICEFLASANAEVPVLPCAPIVRREVGASQYDIIIKDSAFDVLNP